MTRHITYFIQSEDGATTVDWVLLTAGAMSLTLAVFASVSSGTEGITTTVSSTVATRPLTYNW